MVHQGAGFRVTGYVTDGETVLNHVLPCLEAVEHDLVAAGNVHLQRHAFHHLALGKVLERHRHVVGRVNLNVLHIRS